MSVPLSTEDSKKSSEESEEEPTRIQKLDQGDTPNYKLIYDLLGNDFRHSDTPQQDIDIAIRDCKLVVEQGDEMDPRIKFFLERALASLVQQLMMRQDICSDAEKANPVNQFMLCVLDVIVPRLATTDDKDLLMTLNRMLNTGFKFYIPPEESLTSMFKGMFGGKTDAESFINPSKGDPISPFYFKTLQYFGDQGGFKQMVTRLRDTETRPALFTIRMLLKPLVSARAYLKPSFLEPLLDTLRDAVFEQLAYYMENMPTGERANYQYVENSMITLLQTKYSKEEISRDFLSFQLDGSLANIKSDILEKKLHGLRYVQGIVDRALKYIENHSTSGRVARFANWLKGPEEEQYNPYRRPEPKKDTTPIDPEIVVTWITENGVLDMLLSPDAHEAVVRQAIDILVFTENNSPDLDITKYISLVWDISLNQHESVRHIAYKSILHLCGNVSGNEIDFTYDLIKKLELEAYDLETLSFLKQFSTLAMKKGAANTKSIYGLEIYWRFLLDLPGQRIATSVQREAFSHLTQLLALPECASEISKFVERGALLLHEGSAVPQTLELLLHILKLLAGRKKKRVVEHLDEKFDLLKAFFAALPRYRETVTEQSLAAETQMLKFGRRYKHEEVVQITLDFLQYVLGTSSLYLSIEQVDSLWIMMVAHPLIPLERQLFLKWLATAAQEKNTSKRVFELGVMEHVFHHNMCKETDFSQISVARFDLFTKFFIQINVGRKAFAISESGGSFFDVDPEKINGLDELWEIAITCEDQLVATKSAELLNKLALDIEPRKKPIAVREAHISRAMNVMESSSDIQALFRALRLLALYLHIYCEANGKSNTGGPTDGGALMAETEIEEKVTLASGGINVMIKVDNSSGFMLMDIDPRISVDTLKDVIRARIGGSVSLSLFVNGKALTDGMSTLSGNKIATGTEINASRAAGGATQLTFGSFVSGMLRLMIKSVGLQSSPSQLVQTEAKSKISTDTLLPLGRKSLSFASVEAMHNESPETILSQQKHSAALFKLLGHSNENVAHDSWALLSQLPVEQQLLKALVDSGEQTPDWKSVIPSASDGVYKLVYILQLLEALELEKGDSWRISFVSNGGLQHLFTRLLENNGNALSRLLLVRCIRVLLPAAITGEQALQIATKMQSLTVECVSIISVDEVRASGETAEEALRVVASLSQTFPEETRAALKQGLPFSEMVEKSLLRGSVASLRAAVGRGLISLADAIPELQADLTKSLLGILDEPDSRSENANEYWAVMVKLACNFDISTLPSLIAALINYESYDTSVQEDQVLSRQLLTLRVMCASHSAMREKAGQLQFPKHIFDTLLFGSPPLCKSESSRAAAMSLLTEMCRDSSVNFMTIQSLLFKQAISLTERHRNVSSRRANALSALPQKVVGGNFSSTNRSWSLAPLAEVRREGAGYVGLQNLGATCYMNSLTQQLFTVPRFRHGILASELPERPPEQSPSAESAKSEGIGEVAPDEAESDEPEEEKFLKDSVLYQLKVMFANLEWSSRKYFQTRPFAEANKDIDGSPINTSEQQDANEYFGSLFATLEEELSKQDQKIFRQTFTGSLSHQLISVEGCAHRKAKPEPFISISVDVKNKTNLFQSLDLYVEGEILDTYKCEPCDEVRKTQKRMVVEELPNQLMIHLKRFDFSYETLTYSKLNNRLEFPTELDMFPYTVEGVASTDMTQSQVLNNQRQHPDNYYKYKLRGVVIHSGGANAGHYYSLICTNSEKNVWHEFNDTRVSPFDFSKMEETAFGGSYKAKVRDKFGQTKVVERERSNSAYMLVYERVQYFEPDDGEPEDIPEVVKPNALKETLESDNLELSQGSTIYTPEFYRWAWDLLHLYASSASDGQCHKASVELAALYHFYVFGRSADGTMSSSWGVFLERLMRSPRNAEWWLNVLISGGLGSTNECSAVYHYLYDMLVRCPKTSVRRSALKVVSAAFETISKNLSNPKWADEIQVPSLTGEQIPSEIQLQALASAPLHARFVDKLLEELNVLAPRYLLHLSQYCACIATFAKCGTAERRYLLKRGILKFLADDLVKLKGRFGSQSGVLIQQRHQMERHLGNVGAAVDAISVIACASADPDPVALLEPPKEASTGKKKKHTPESPEDPLPNPLILQSDEGLIALSNEEWTHMLSKSFIHTCAKNMVALNALHTLFKRVAWESIPFSEYLFTVTLESFKLCKDALEFEGSLSCFGVLVNMKDSLQSWRCSELCHLSTSLFTRSLKRRGRKAEIRKLVTWFAGLAKGTSGNLFIRKWVLKHDRDINDVLARAGLGELDTSQLTGDK